MALKLAARYSPSRTASCSPGSRRVAPGHQAYRFRQAGQVGVQLGPGSVRQMARRLVALCLFTFELSRPSGTAAGQITGYFAGLGPLAAVQWCGWTVNPYLLLLITFALWAVLHSLTAMRSERALRRWLGERAYANALPAAVAAICWPWFLLCRFLWVLATQVSPTEDVALVPAGLYLALAISFWPWLAWALACCRPTSGASSG